jgi:uncharacterized protein (DUF305 family)
MTPLRFIVAVVGAASMAFAVATTFEATFLSESEAAMQKMMADMEVKPSGDVDRDFAAMMIPHHQGAIEMAVAELRYGKNEQLRRIAQEIIVGQQQEIAAMHLALGEAAPPSAPASTQISASGVSPTAAHDDHHPLYQD